MDELHSYITNDEFKNCVLEWKDDNNEWHAYSTPLQYRLKTAIETQNFNENQHTIRFFSLFFGVTLNNVTRKYIISFKDCKQIRLSKCDDETCFHRPLIQNQTHERLCRFRIMTEQEHVHYNAFLLNLTELKNFEYNDNNTNILSTLSENEIQKFYNITNALVENNNKEDLNCCVCLNSFYCTEKNSVTNKPMCIKGCFHTICENCLHSLMANSNHCNTPCPMCRFNFKIEDLFLNTYLLDFINKI